MVNTERVKLTIDGIQIEADRHSTILQAAALAGIRIPTLCYLKDINEIGACRVCVVEVEGYAKLVTACNNRVKEGMVVPAQQQLCILRQKRKLFPAECGQ